MSTLLSLALLAAPVATGSAPPASNTIHFRLTTGGFNDDAAPVATSVYGAVVDLGLRLAVTEDLRVGVQLGFVYAQFGVEDETEELLSLESSDSGTRFASPELSLDYVFRQAGSEGFVGGFVMLPLSSEIDEFGELFAVLQALGSTGYWDAWRWVPEAAAMGARAGGQVDFGSSVFFDVESAFALLLPQGDADNDLLVQVRVGPGAELAPMRFGARLQGFAVPTSESDDVTSVVLAPWVGLAFEALQLELAAQIPLDEPLNGLGSTGADFYALSLGIRNTW